MADATTPEGFTLPTVGLDRDTWGGITNENWQLCDALLAAIDAKANANAAAVQYLSNVVRAYVEPIGSIKLWPTGGAPGGWLGCDGTAISRSVFSELFALIGGTWGAGDGSTTFNLPNMQGCVPVHRGDWMPFGGRVGETSHAITEQELAPHYHAGATDYVGDHSHYVNQPDFSLTQGGGPYAAAGITGGYTNNAGGHQHNLYTSYVGAGWAHNNIQPSLGIMFIIKVQYWGF
jgi:microcystin-dependent protein